MAKALKQGPEEPKPLHLLLWLIAAVLAMAIIATGCSPKIIKQIQHDTTYVERVRVDSLYQHDSVFVKEKGDTLYIYKERVRDHYVLKRDTVRLVKVDSVVVERVKEVKVPTPLTLAQRVKIGAFWWLFAGVVVLLLWTFRKYILKLLKI